MGKVLVVDIEKCVGCKACEIACSNKHHDEFNPFKSRITVEAHEDSLFVPIFCSQCAKPSCKAVCKPDAISCQEINGSWVVKIDQEKCIGCKRCIKACPYGVISLLKEKKCVQKCDLCDGDPECLKFCVRNALAFIDEEEMVQQKKRDTVLGIIASKREVE